MNNIFDAILSLSDASFIWNKDDSTLRRNIKNGKFKEDIDVKKFGKQWVITKEAMIREYGQPIKKPD